VATTGEGEASGDSAYGDDGRAGRRCTAMAAMTSGGDGGDDDSGVHAAPQEAEAGCAAAS
jgi:hypothetical protein